MEHLAIRLAHIDYQLIECLRGGGPEWLLCVRSNDSLSHRPTMDRCDVMPILRQWPPLAATGLQTVIERNSEH